MMPSIYFMNHDTILHATTSILIANIDLNLLKILQTVFLRCYWCPADVNAPRQSCANKLMRNMNEVQNNNDRATKTDQVGNSF